jgi:hypothetical protein
MSRIGWVLAILLLGLDASAKPLLRPQKYHGPIPKGSFALMVGFVGGASGDELFSFLDREILNRHGQAFSDDFGNGLVVEATYTRKVHPRFAFALTTGWRHFKATSHGYFVEHTFLDTLQVKWNYDRRFTVDAIAFEANALFYLADASVDNFQPYLGGGLGLWIPRAEYEIEKDDPEHGNHEKTTQVEWSAEPTIHGLLGSLYYLNNRTAIKVEIRYQIAQSRFPMRIDTDNGPQDVSFLMDYTGFTLLAGLQHSF